MNQLSKKEMVQIALITLSVCITILGVLFLLTAMEAVIVFEGFAGMKSVLSKYVVVILLMATGIMTFSNVAMTIESDKMRNILVVGVTAFSTVLTLPLVYVFIAIFPAQSGIIGPVGELMMLSRIVADFNLFVPNTGGLYVIYVLLFIMSIIFITFPLLTGVLAVKGKAIKIGKNNNGKFAVFFDTLPVIKKRKILEEKAQENTEESNEVLLDVNTQKDATICEENNEQKTPEKSEL